MRNWTLYENKCTEKFILAVNGQCKTSRGNAKPSVKSKPTGSIWIQNFKGQCKIILNQNLKDQCKAIWSQKHKGQCEDIWT